METAPHAELDLRKRAIKYEARFFKDLTLEEKRIEKKLASYQMEVEGQWVDAVDDLQLDVCIHSGWIFRYRRSRKHFGLCRYKQRTIDIRLGLPPQEEKGTLLHEMIHAYEYMLYPSLREWLLLDLYRRLRQCIGERKTHRFIDANTHSVTRESAHGSLFLLKSLDLDERLSWKHGTVFGYGREHLFSTPAPPA